MGNHNHPYIPNSQPETRQEMMQEIDIKRIDELYADIPETVAYDAEHAKPRIIVSQFI